jgi:DNA processing protein
MEGALLHSGLSREKLCSWLIFGLFTSNNPGLRRKLVARYGSVEEAVRASQKRWRQDGLLRPGRGKGIFGPVRSGAKPEVTCLVDDTSMWSLDQIERARELGAGILIKGGPGYPGLLERIPDPPAVLYIRGAAEILSYPGVALVGARRASAYGLAMARSLGSGLAKAGVTVVSGGARGVDTESHLGALEEGGPTIVVMGSGLDIPYPSENWRLFEAAAEQGVLVSEFPFGTRPQPYHFPIRNRTIAGLSLGVAVIEGKSGSGSLITAECAMDCGRDVYAVPGPVTSPLSEGPNQLIKDGAALIRNSDDIISEVPLAARLMLEDTSKSRQVAEDESKDELPPGMRTGPCAVVWSVLRAEEASSIDELAGKTDLPAGTLLGALTELEMKGRVRQLPGGRYARRQ